MNNWIPIAELPESYKTNKKKFAVSARDVDLYISSDIQKKFTSSAVIVWYCEGNWGLPYGSFIAWEYDWSPTHFCELDNFMPEQKVIPQIVPSRGVK